MNTNGIGLGLVIADQIVKKFDGDISFESVPGQGSNFTYSMKLFENNETQIDVYAPQFNSHNKKITANCKDLFYKWVP